MIFFFACAKDAHRNNRRLKGKLKGSYVFQERCFCFLFLFFKSCLIFFLVRLFFVFFLFFLSQNNSCVYLCVCGVLVLFWGGAVIGDRLQGGDLLYKTIDTEAREMILQASEREFGCK